MGKVKTKKKRKPKTLSKLKQEAWKVFSQYIRLRDALLTTGSVEYGECITCSRVKPTVELQAGHFISRTKSSLYFDEENVAAQCSKCNVLCQGEQYAFGQAIIGRYGNKALERILDLKKKNPLTKRSKQDFIELKETYQGLVKELLAGEESPWK